MTRRQRVVQDITFSTDSFDINNPSFSSEEESGSFNKQEYMQDDNSVSSFFKQQSVEEDAEILSDYVSESKREYENISGFNKKQSNLNTQNINESSGSLLSIADEIYSQI